MEYKDVSVHTNVSCLALMAPIIDEPAESLNDPAVFVGKGSHSVTFSWSLKAISIGSMFPVREVPDIGSAPKQITCLSTSLTKTCSDTVGGKLAPAKSDNATALDEVPLLVSQ